MNETQTEMKAIHAKLQSIQANPRHPHRSSSAPAKPTTPRKPETAEFAPPSTPLPSLSQTAFDRLGQSTPPQPFIPSAKAPASEPPTSDELWQHRSDAYVQRLQQLRNPPIPSASEQQLQASLRLLEAQAKHINQLSRTQEAAIRELQTIAQQVEQEWQAVEQMQNDWAGQPTPQVGLPRWSACDYQDIAVPYVTERDQGGFKLGTRAIEMTQAYRDASETAQTLRQRREQQTQIAKPRKRSRPGWEKQLRQWLSADTETAPTETTPPVKTSASSEPFTLQETLTLLIGAALTRILLNLLLQAFPFLWLPIMALLIVPALLAVYRSTTHPQSGIIWGYRLCMIMLGLLIGGRLS